MRRNRDAARHHADACRVDEQFVGRATLDHLGVAGDDVHTRFSRNALHAGHHAPQGFQRKTFLKHHAARQIQRFGTADGQVVHRARNCQRADVTTGEEQR